MAITGSTDHEVATVKAALGVFIKGYQTQLRELRMTLPYADRVAPIVQKMEEAEDQIAYLTELRDTAKVYVVSHWPHS